MNAHDSDFISATLLLAAKHRDDEAWSRIEQMFRPIVFGWFNRYWRLPHDAAENLVQNVMLRALFELHNFQTNQKGQSFTGWLWTIARNETSDFRFFTARSGVAFGGTDYYRYLAEIPEVPPPDGIADIQLKLSRLLSLMQGEFGDSTRVVFERVVVGGESTSDVASDLGMKQNTVREEKRRILKRLRDEWSQLFGEWPFEPREVNHQ